MRAVFDALWRAAAYCLHPRVVLWSLLPLLVAGGLAFGLGWLYWEQAVGWVRAGLEQWELIARLRQWLESIGGQTLNAMMAPVLVVTASVPVIVLVALLLVATLMTPAIVALVAARRFPDLERKNGAGWWQGLFWSLVCTVAALLALVLSIPLWFVPPLVLLLPPLIWGWLTTRVFSFDVLAVHASAAERRLIVHEHRGPLLFIGIACGYLGAAPSLVWAFGAATLIFAPLLVVVSLWLYTLVFAFAACWFAHYALAELQRLRAAPLPPAAPVIIDTPVALPHP